MPTGIDAAYRRPRIAILKILSHSAPACAPAADSEARSGQVVHCRVSAYHDLTAYMLAGGTARRVLEEYRCEVLALPGDPVAGYREPAGCSAPCPRPGLFTWDHAAATRARAARRTVRGASSILSPSRMSVTLSTCLPKRRCTLLLLAHAVPCERSGRPTLHHGQRRLSRPGLQGRT